MSDGCGHRSGWDFLHGTCNGCGADAITLYKEMREEAEGYKARLAEVEGREITREQIANIISDKLEFANGWKISEDSWRELSLQTADRIRAALWEGEKSKRFTE